MSNAVESFYGCLCSGSESWRNYVTPDVQWNVSAPIDDLIGEEALFNGFCKPFTEAIAHISRRPFIELSDISDETEWHSATGVFSGLFANSFLGIPATGKAVYIRFTEMVKLQEGKIQTCYLILDFLDLMEQAGVYPLRKSLGKNGTILPPSSMDGLVHQEKDLDDSLKTKHLVEQMLQELGRFDGKSLASMNLQEYWHEDFIWYGPAGIGTTFGIEGFRAHHQGPFVFSFPDRVVDHCAAFIAQGHYAATGGWPHMHGTHTGEGWLGLPPSGKYLSLRVMDIWRREGELLKENWVAIDIIDMCRQMGLDVFEMMDQVCSK